VIFNIYFENLPLKSV